MELHQTQKLVASDTHRFRVLCSGRQWGKTTLAVQEMLGLAYYKSGSRTCYIAPTFTQARDIAWRMLKDATKTIWAKEPNETRLELTIKSNDGNFSEIWFRGYENIEGLRGQQFDFLVIDEVAVMNNWSYGWEAVLEPTLNVRRGSALFISTPNGFNHFYNLYKKESVNTEYKSFTFTSFDSPYTDKETIENKKSDPTITPEYFEQEYMAKFTKLAGAVYKEWNEEKQFVPLEYDQSLPLHITMDFGVADPTSIIWIQPYGSEFRVVDYFEGVNSSIEYYIQLINSKSYRTAELFTGDDSGRSRTLTTGTSPIEIMASKGINIRTTPGLRIPDQIRATHGIMPRLYVSNKLSRFRDCLLNYRYPDARTGIDQSNEIPIHDEYSHAMRALEYYVVNSTNAIQKKPDEYYIKQLPIESWKNNSWY